MHFNIAAASCDRHAAVKSDAPAVLFEDADGKSQVMTFGQLRAQTNRLANVLHHLAIRLGDRVAIHLPQSFEAAFAHVAIYKLGTPSGFSLPGMYMKLP